MLLVMVACSQKRSEAPASPPEVAVVVSSAVVSGQAAPAGSGFPAVVTLEPLAAGGASVTSDGSLESSGSLTASEPVFMDQIASSFYPPTLLARVGQTVQFLNSEGVMHNVNVATDGGALIFNVATPPGFESYQHAFLEAGVYRVKCDIHPNMSAFIVAVATPYAAVADRDGRFAVRGVPPGRYEASVWSVDAARRVTRPVEVPSGIASVDLDLRSAELAE